MAKHSICHIEWNCTDLARAQKFFGGLFEWKFEKWGEDYLMFKPPQGPGGGLMRCDKFKPGESPSIYVHVDEIEPYLGKAKELGGGVAVPKSEIPGIGWFALLTDPDGNIVGLFQSK